MKHRPQQDDICANHHRGDQLSFEAHIRGRKSAASTRFEILRLALEMKEYGITCFEVERALGLRHQTASARCSELKRDGLLVPNGEKRATDTGCNAAVLVRSKFFGG